MYQNNDPHRHLPSHHHKDNNKYTMNSGVQKTTCWELAGYTRGGTWQDRALIGFVKDRPTEASLALLSDEYKLKVKANETTLIAIDGQVRRILKTPLAFGFMSPEVLINLGIVKKEKENVNIASQDAREYGMDAGEQRECVQSLPEGMDASRSTFDDSHQLPIEAPRC